MGKIKDLTNQTFGRWTVLEFAGVNAKRNSLWKCQCTCGNVKEVVGYTLTMGTSQSCGCATLEALAERNENNLIGQKKGRLTAIECIGSNKHQKREWIFQCECGNITRMVASDFVNGHIKSCGCLKNEMNKSFFSKRLGAPVYFGTKISKSLRNQITQFCKTEKNNRSMICSICESIENVHLHHLYGVNNKPELALEKDNLIELCSECHNSFHLAYGYGINTPIQFIEFYESYV